MQELSAIGSEVRLSPIQLVNLERCKLTRYTLYYAGVAVAASLAACAPAMQRSIPSQVMPSTSSHARTILSHRAILALARTFAKSRPIQNGTTIYLRSDLDAHVRVTSGKVTLNDLHGALELVAPGAHAPQNSTMLYTFGASDRHAMATEAACSGCGEDGGTPAPTPAPQDGCPQTQATPIGPIAAFNVDPLGRNIGTAVTNKYGSAHVNYQIILWRSSGFGESIFGAFDTTSSDVSFDTSLVGYDAFVSADISLTVTNNNPPPPDIGPQPQDSQTGTTSTTCAS